MKAELSKNKVTGEDILERLRWRYAAKRYDATRRIADEDWAILEQSLALAPSSYGLQPYRFIVVEDPAVRERLRAAGYGQPQITEASHLIVFAYKKSLSNEDVERFVERTAEVRGQESAALAGFEKSLKGALESKAAGDTHPVWNSRQVYIALGFLLETAALLGVDASPMEGFDPAEFDRILGLEDYASVVICALGYRDAESDWLAPLPKVRRREEDLFVRI